MKLYFLQFLHGLDYNPLPDFQEHFVYVETAKPINKNVVLNKLIKVNIPAREIIDFEDKKPNELTREQKEKLKMELEEKVKELKTK